MLNEIGAKRDAVYASAWKHKAEKLWDFGSCVRKNIVPTVDREKYFCREVREEMVAFFKGVISDKH